MLLRVINLLHLWQKRKEILHNKEQSLQSSVQQPVHSSVQQPVQSTVQQPVQSTVQQPVQSTIQQPVQSTVWSNDTYAYGVGVLTVLAIGVCVFLTYNTFPKNKKQANEKKRSTKTTSYA